MNYTNSNITQSIQLKDDDFSLEMAESFELALLINNKVISFAVIEPNQYRLVQLESFEFENEPNTEQLISNIEYIFTNNETLKNSFWKTIKIGFTHNKSTLIPEVLFDEENMSKYFQINCAFDADTEDLLLHRHRNAEIITLFSVEKSILEYLKNHYSSKKIEFIHLGSLLIEGLLHYDTATTEPTIYIHISNGLASFIIKTNGNIAYYNSFHIKDFKDLLYYTLFIAEEFNYAQENLCAIVWGNTGFESEYVNSLKEYINTVTLGNRPKGVSAGYKFSDIANHQYFELLAMPLV